MGILQLLFKKYIYLSLFMSFFLILSVGHVKTKYFVDKKNCLNIYYLKEMCTNIVS